MIPRAIEDEARYALTQFRALCITGPRQSGKTTLSRRLFKGKPYVNFEDPEVQHRFEEDPGAFLHRYRSGAVFDEVQRVPAIFRHLQVILDGTAKRGGFILTGSNNFLLQEQVSQSLAGRAGYLTLLPLSFEELKIAGLAKGGVNRLILRGGYPEIWMQGLQAGTWLSSYIQTYVQRDVRQLRNISNLAAFSRMVVLCAKRVGQVLNRDELSREVGVDTKTVQSWLGLLEGSFILFQLQPWYNNLNKRIIKSPKLYFYDTGLLCTLLGIRKVEQLLGHGMYGAIFENWCMSEIRKNRFNRGMDAGMNFLRDSSGNEVDLVLEKGGDALAVEVKSTKSEESRIPEGLKFWARNNPGKQGVLLYQGRSKPSPNPLFSFLCWDEIDSL